MQPSLCKQHSIAVGSIPCLAKRLCRGRHVDSEFDKIDIARQHPSVKDTHLAVDQQFQERNGLLRAILIHARHIEVIQEDHEALAHGGAICILGTLLCAILQYHKVA